MYDIGDKVVYPMHGAGIIESIEQGEIMGEIKNYYILLSHISAISTEYIPLSLWQQLMVQR